MASRDPGQTKDAVMLYQRRGDFDGALALLQENGLDRAEAVAALRDSDIAAARATAILAAILIALGSVGMVFWPDGRWLLFALIAWGVERAFRSMTLIRRARTRGGRS